MVVVRGGVSGGAGQADPDAFGGAWTFHLFRKILSALLSRGSTPPSPQPQGVLHHGTEVKSNPTMMREMGNGKSYVPLALESFQVNKRFAHALIAQGAGILL